MSSKLREALLKADVLISIATFDDGVKMDEVDKIRSEIKSALAEPLRNCDVGAADEQTKRFEDFCLKHIGCAEETGGRHCVGCPLEKASKNIIQKCELYWAQMPYESEVK